MNTQFPPPPEDPPYVPRELIRDVMANPGTRIIQEGSNLQWAVRCAKVTHMLKHQFAPQAGQDVWHSGNYVHQFYQVSPLVADLIAFTLLCNANKLPC